MRRYCGFVTILSSTDNSCVVVFERHHWLHAEVLWFCDHFVEHTLELLYHFWYHALADLIQPYSVFDFNDLWACSHKSCCSIFRDASNDLPCTFLLL